MNIGHYILLKIIEDSGCGGLSPGVFAQKVKGQRKELRPKYCTHVKKIGTRTSADAIGSLDISNNLG
jgi:hypothetical protein